jgi:antitoxin PrlF
MCDIRNVVHDTIRTEPDMAGIEHATLRDRGQITLPAAVRDALDAHTGDEIVFSVLEDGTVVLTTGQLVPKSQAWFWTREWQAGEHQATKELADGNGEIFQQPEDMFDNVS